MSENLPVVVVQVTRGDELPKKNYESKLHPTYVITVRLKQDGEWSEAYTSTRFFEHYRNLNNNLVRAGCVVSSDKPFPPTKRRSILGVRLDEESLQERCYLLNQWINAIFESYGVFPEEGQVLIKDFLLSGSNKDELVFSILKALSFDSEKDKDKNDSAAEVKKESEEVKQVANPAANAIITHNVTFNLPFSETNESSDKPEKDVNNTRTSTLQRVQHLRMIMLSYLQPNWRNSLFPQKLVTS